MMKHYLCSLFVVFAMLAMLCPLSAQTLMQINLNDGSQLSFPVRDIGSVTWVAADDGDQNIDGETSVTGSATTVTNQTATVTAYANDILDNLSTDLRVGIIYTTEGTPSRSNGQQVTVSISDLAADGKYSITLTGLAPSTTYAYRSFVYQSGLWFYGHVKTFTTKGHPESQGESFTTGAASKVTCFSAVVSASVNIDPATTYRTLTYGICYGTSFEPTTSNSTVQCNDRNAEGAYTATLRGLLGNTTYYYRPYAIIDGYTTYGQTSSFQTQADNVVETLSVDAVTGVVKAHLSLGGGAYSALELGVCYATTEQPTVTDGRVTTNEVDDERNFEVRLPVLYGTYYVRAYVLIDGAAHYGAAVSATFVIVRRAVDLGLSVKWANMNVGASAPEGYGDYFAWGETMPKTTYDWSTYKWCQGSEDTMTKYCTNSSYGTVDNKTTLEAEDDAATANWGGTWRMPTSVEQDELRTKCSWTWTTQNGVNGYSVTGPNGNSIFLPAAGYRRDSGLSSVGSYGYSWSSSLPDSDSNRARYLYFNSGYHGWYYYGSRSFGLSVRPVTE